MLKKYILALAILGLVAPHAAMGGLGLKNIVGSRFFWGAVTSFYEHCANKYFDGDRLFKRCINQSLRYFKYSDPSASSRFNRLRDPEKAKKMDLINNNMYEMFLLAGPKLLITTLPSFIIIAYDIKNLFTPGKRIPWGFIGSKCSDYIWDYAARKMSNKNEVNHA